MGGWVQHDSVSNSLQDALGLLSSRFHHTVVRSYAVKRLQDANDDDLRLYLLQLVQALKFEVSFI